MAIKLKKSRKAVFGRKKPLVIGLGCLLAAALALGLGLGIRSARLHKADRDEPASALVTETAAGEDVVDIIAADTTPAPTAAPEITQEATAAPSFAPTPEPTRNPLLMQGQMSDYVASMQDRLMDLGYLDIDEPTRYFGSATENAVQLFQRQHGLEMDGFAGQETLKLLFSDDAQKYVMKLDTQGLDVENLQRQLEFLGYYSKVIDGYYGEATQDAVKSFQSRNELTADGLAGERTLEKLFSPEAVPAAHIVVEQLRRANIQTMVNTAYAQLGKKYVLGAVGPRSFDCSGLVYYCLKMAGSTRGRYNAAGYSQVSDWKKLTNIDNLQIGDLLFFYNNSYSKVGHVGIYVGNGMMIDASASNGKVVLRPCRTYYWRRHFACARRPW